MSYEEIKEEFIKCVALLMSVEEITKEELQAIIKQFSEAPLEELHALRQFCLGFIKASLEDGGNDYVKEAMLLIHLINETLKAKEA